MDKLSISDLQSECVNSIGTIELCSKIITNNTAFGLIARTDLQFSSLSITKSDWISTFGYEMPTIQKITKVINVKAHDYSNKEYQRLNFFFGISKTSEWVVPNLILRDSKSEEMRLCVTYYDNDGTFFDDYFIVDNHLANDKEIDFIQSHLYKPQKIKSEPSNLPKARLYKLSSIISIDLSDIIEKTMI